MKAYNALRRTVFLLVAAAIFCGLSLPSQAATKVLLLLHGMNSSPATWNDFVASQFSSSNNKGVILAGALLNSVPKPNSRGVYCYAVEFGAYDKTEGLTGLENLTASTDTLPTAGDFSGFTTLSKEVEQAIACILEIHKDAQITLLAHSRGGIAAREYLQNPLSPNRAVVISLLTTGAPHKGSRLGRVYSYLAINARLSSAAANNDWSVVDSLRSQYKFDVRRPVINQLADDQPFVPALNAKVGQMPAKMTYGNLRYTITDLGYLGRSWGISYNVFYGLNVFLAPRIPPLSDPAKLHILGAGKSPSNYKGDGIVEADSQNLLNVSGRPSFAKTYDMAYTRSVYHTEETALGQVKDMTTALKSLTGWWR